MTDCIENIKNIGYKILYDDNGNFRLLELGKTKGYPVIAEKNNPYHTIMFQDKRQMGAYLTSVCLTGNNFFTHASWTSRQLGNGTQLPEKVYIGLESFTRDGSACCGRYCGYVGKKNNHGFNDLFEWVMEHFDITVEQLFCKQDIAIYKTVIDGQTMYYLQDGTTNPAICSDTIVGLAKEYVKHRLDVFSDIDDIPGTITKLASSFKTITPSVWKASADDPWSEEDGHMLVSVVGNSGFQWDPETQTWGKKLIIRYLIPGLVNTTSRIERPFYIRSDVRVVHQFDKTSNTYIADPSFDTAVNDTIELIMSITMRAKAMYERYYGSLTKLISFSPYMPL